MAEISQEQFPKVEGQYYLNFFKKLHKHRKPNWYLEVGTNKGNSLRLAECASISVDPNFIVSQDVIGQKPELHCFASTSDAFFASKATRKLGAKIDLAFLDGMHLFEFTLRDFMNCEKLMARDGMIILHDVIPINFDAAQREWDKDKTKHWTGDIWRVVLALKDARPDLDVRVLDAAPSGIALITNLDPESTDLDVAYEKLVEKYLAIELSEKTLPDILEKLAIESTKAYTKELGDAASASLDFAIKIHVSEQKNRADFGEFHYADSLAASLESLGHKARIDFHESWATKAKQGEVEIWLRGKYPPEVNHDNLAVQWTITNGNNLTGDDLTGLSHCFLASNKMPSDAGDVPCSTLLQCTDTRRFPAPAHINAPSHEVLFVGSGYPTRKRRGMVVWALEAGIETAVYGRFWSFLENDWHKGTNVDNRTLGALYQNAGIVLNDHHRSMRGEAAYVNNRVFDVLACGVPLISDRVQGLPEGFEEFVYFAEGAEELAEKVDLARSENLAMSRRRREFARHVAQNHSFDKRAADMVARVNELRAGKKT